MSARRQKSTRSLWSPDEDERLLRHIERYGLGCWSLVPKLAGLRRCGKSCRLRWANYLRPGLRRGSFTEAEENLIIRLHKTLGNRWSRIAAYLPGRSDNDIKNFWNGRARRRTTSTISDNAAIKDDNNSSNSEYSNHNSASAITDINLIDTLTSLPSNPALADRSSANYINSEQKSIIHYSVCNNNNNYISINGSATREINPCSSMIHADNHVIKDPNPPPLSGLIRSNSAVFPFLLTNYDNNVINANQSIDKTNHCLAHPNPANEKINSVNSADLYNRVEPAKIEYIQFNEPSINQHNYRNHHPPIATSQTVIPKLNNIAANNSISTANSSSPLAATNFTTSISNINNLTNHNQNTVNLISADINHEAGIFNNINNPCPNYSSNIISLQYSWSNDQHLPNLHHVLINDQQVASTVQSELNYFEEISADHQNFHNIISAESSSGASSSLIMSTDSANYSHYPTDHIQDPAQQLAWFHH